jgi:tRNA nucleotidyltransferase (CCA-adding enzyme)
MKTYLVGGAVRDALLGLPVRERDYMVVGANPERMLALGFKPVGRDFPVFLHPQTHEEYALARTERKTAQGHQGFVFHADETVSLEEDLYRRDLTINAIAQDETGKLFDPFHGQADLSARVLRHVSPAFTEDPLRILRVARFRAYLGSFNFTIAPRTLKLMEEMVQAQALDELSDERIWQEILKALQTDTPELFFSTLQELGFLNTLFPHLTQTGIKALIQVKSKQTDPVIRFATLAHEGAYSQGCPSAFSELRQLAEITRKAAEHFAHATPEAKLQLFKKLDFLRRPERLQQWIAVMQIIAPAFPRPLFDKALHALKQIDRKAIAATHPSPQSIHEAMILAELTALG